MNEQHHYQLEICLDSADSVLRAREGGADRVELCDNLFGGGTTPSIGTIRAARRAADLKIHVIIRPRPGDFHYSDLEFQVMLEDITACVDSGVDGVVIGMLNTDGTVDMERNGRLVKAAGRMSVTFHRAFDVAREPFEAMERIIELGCSRILTSGQENSVLEGADLIRRLREEAGERIIIMPGGDITERNLARIVEATGAAEYHMNLDVDVPGDMRYRPSHIPMGGVLRMPEFTNTYTGVERVRAVRAGLSDLSGG